MSSPSVDSPFFVKVTLALAMIIVVLYLFSVSVEANTARFGQIAWIALIPGMLAFVAAIFVTWSNTIIWMDRRALRRYRATPDQIMLDGQTVALSGKIIVEGQPLISPFSETPCAGYTYKITGEGRESSNRTSNRRLCLFGYHLTHANLDCGSHQFPIGAIADVDTDLRNTTMENHWGDRGHALIKAAAEAGSPVEEIATRDTLDKAYRQTTVPCAQDFFVGHNLGTSNAINVIEDILPVDQPVTILGTYQVRTGGLDGQRLGGLKCFAGHLDERLVELDKEWRMGLKVGMPLLGVGLALLTLARWMPSF